MALPRLEFANGFESELLEAARWYAERSVWAANEFVDEVEEALEQIQEYPERWPLLGRHSQISSEAISILGHLSRGPRSDLCCGDFALRQAKQVLEIAIAVTSVI